MANSFIDVYDQNDLVDYLEKLKATQKKYPGQTLGFQLTNSMHRIFVGYDMTNNSWTLIDIDDFQEIFFESSDAVARQIISGLSPNKASDFSDIRLLQQKLQTDLSDLREKLKSCSADFSMQRGDLIIRYDANTAQFTVQNPKPGPCPAIFTTDIYTISSIQEKLENYLRKLVCEPEKKSPESPTLNDELELKASEDAILNIELQHLTYKIKIQYNRATKTWLLFSNEDVSTSCGNTKDTRQITQWVGKLSILSAAPQ